MHKLLNSAGVISKPVVEKALIAKFFGNILIHICALHVFLNLVKGLVFRFIDII